MNITLRQIDAFLALANTLSFSKAADQVHLSQPAFSISIRLLEETIGGRLFDRDTRTVELTPLGREFLLFATDLKSSVQHGLSHIQNYVAGKRGTLSLAVSPSVAAAFLPSVVARFMSDYPNVDFKLHDVLAEVAVERVRGKSVDLALMPWCDGADDLIQRVLVTDELVFLCSSRHALAKRRRVNWDDIQRYPQIARQGGSDMRGILEQAYLANGQIFKPLFEVVNIGTMLGLIAAGLGCGVLPRSTLSSANQDGLTVVPFVSRDRLSRKICAVTLRGRAHNPLVENFVALCQSKAREG